MLVRAEMSMSFVGHGGATQLSDWDERRGRFREDMNGEIIEINVFRINTSIIC